MIVNLIQNLENKMEAQTNILETWIKKIEEMFKKDLEKLKNRQPAINITITDIKNTLEGTNSGLSEAKEHMSDLEDRIVELTEPE